ncbi:MAG: Cof-type HAD-IIB family hydrolase [Ktedonobacteraceae bacterium]
MQDIPDIKLLAIDIDGTLLTPEGKIAPRTLMAVRAAQEAGIIVTLATGRRYLNTRHLAEALGLAIPLITYDGALIIQHPQGEILHTHPLQALIAQQAVDILIRHAIQPVVHHITASIEEIWTGPSELDNAWIADYFAMFPRSIRRMPYGELCSGHKDPLRVVAFAPEDVIASLIPEASALRCSWSAIKQGNYGYAEMAIMHTHCSKASGVTALAQQVGIPLAQVMAIGDNNNDIEMLEAVGWGVAMGQASDSVRSIAQAVTTSNAEDGVARAIERYALRSRTAL